MSVITRVLGPNPKGSKLTVEEIDSNWLHLDDLVHAGAAVSLSFVQGDWSSHNAEFWKLDLTHGLNYANPLIEIFSSTAKVVLPHETEVVDSNTVRLLVPKDPNLRFDGTATFSK